MYRSLTGPPGQKRQIVTISHTQTYQFHVLELAVNTGGFHINLSGSILLLAIPLAFSFARAFSLASSTASVSTMTCWPLLYRSMFRFCNVCSTSVVVMALSAPTSSTDISPPPPPAVLPSLLLLLLLFFSCSMRMSVMVSAQ